MGTRADFYIGRGKTAEWLGSVAYDGYPEGFDRKGLLDATAEEEFRKAVAAELASRDDATTIDQGWPLALGGYSRTTDYTYAFDDGKVYTSGFGGAWFDPKTPEADTEENHSNKAAEFPNMKDRQKVTLGARSGVMILGSK